MFNQPNFGVYFNCILVAFFLMVLIVVLFKMGMIVFKNSIDMVKIF